MADIAVLVARLRDLGRQYAPNNGGYSSVELYQRLNEAADALEAAARNDDSRLDYSDAYPEPSSSDPRDPEAVREACAKVCEDLSKTNVGYEGALGTAADWALEANAMNYCAKAIRALPLAPLRSTEQGWVSVPREPNEEMIDAAFRGYSYPQDFGLNAQIRDQEEAKRIYRAMLAAAPSANAGK